MGSRLFSRLLGKRFCENDKILFFIPNDGERGKSEQCSIPGRPIHGVNHDIPPTRLCSSFCWAANPLKTCSKDVWLREYSPTHKASRCFCSCSNPELVDHEHKMVVEMVVRKLERVGSRRGGGRGWDR